MTDVQLIRSDEVERALASVRAAPNADALSALALDALTRQAEGRTLFVGREFAAQRAQEHGVDRDAAKTGGGNLLEILERGPESALERAVVGGFAVRGLGAQLGAADDEERSRLVFRFVRHADWLEVATPYVVHPFVDALLDESLAARVWAELAQAVVDEAAGRDGGRPEVRARNAARLTSLSSSSTTAAREALRKVVRSAALDEATRSLASTLAGDGAEVPVVSPRLEGLVGARRRRGALEVVRWLTGWAMLAWLARGLAFLLGLRRHAEVRLDRDGLEIKTQVLLLGRRVRESNETWKLSALTVARREVRYPSVHLIAGAVALSIGVLFGGLVLFDGARSGELTLLVVAAAIILAGASLDLALDVLVPGTRGRVTVELHDGARAPVRLTRVRVEEADAFLRALRSRAS